MTIGFLQLDLYLPNTHSLKDKRSITSRLKHQIRAKFNVSISEIDHNDRWGNAVIGIVMISNDGKMVNSTLGVVEKFIECNFDVVIINRKLEFF